MSNTPFFLGVNYPWRNYGQDFGRAGAAHHGISLTPAQEQVGGDFRQIAETGATIVRWFLFGDGRSGFTSKGEIPRRPDEFLFVDVAAALQLAECYNLKLCFSLIDYHWLQESPQNQNAHPNRRVLHFAAGREAFLQSVLIPLFREFRGHPALFAWEIANEPEWTIREFQSRSAGKLHYADFRAYAGEIARAVHEYAGVPVTLASARLLWVRAWTELGLDYYQAHYYPAAEEETKRDLAQQLTNLPPLDKPLWMGELPARDPAHPRYSLRQSLELCRSAGLCGAAVWRWTEPESQGTDVTIGRVDPAELKAWSTSERSEGQRA